ncbi:hypothetical protein V2O64_00745 [Verrucomicrobiaceae bacterium 227]
MQKDIQELIPEAHRDLVEAVPKGFFESAVLGGILLGSLCGSLLCMLVANWMIPGVFVLLLVIQRIWVWKSDKEFDRRIAAFKSRDLTWDDANEK